MVEPRLNEFVKELIENEKKAFKEQQKQQKIINSQIKFSLKEIEEKIKKEEIPEFEKNQNQINNESFLNNINNQTSLNNLENEIRLKNERPQKNLNNLKNEISQSLKNIKKLKNVLSVQKPPKNSKPKTKTQKQKEDEIKVIKEINTNNKLNITEDFTKIKRKKIIENPIFLYKLPGLKMTNYLKYPYKEFSIPSLKNIPSEKKIINLIFKVKLDNYQIYINNVYKNPRNKEIDIFIGKEKLIMDPKSFEVKIKGEMLIPEIVKERFGENPALYYLFFYLSIKNGAVPLDFEFEDGFTVEDCLLYIYVKMWGNEPENEI